MLWRSILVEWWADDAIHQWCMPCSVVSGNTRSYSVSMTMSLSRCWKHDCWSGVDDDDLSSVSTCSSFTISFVRQCLSRILDVLVPPPRIGAAGSSPKCAVQPYIDKRSLQKHCSRSFRLWHPIQYERAPLRVRLTSHSFKFYHPCFCA